MLRRSLLCCIALITACGTAPQSLDKVLPESVDAYRRGPIGPLDQIPETISRHGVAQAAETTYTGAGEIRVRVFRMKAPTSAFELIQQWRQSEGVAAYQGPYFFVTDTQNADPQAVSRLLRALQESAKGAASQ